MPIPVLDRVPSPTTKAVIIAFPSVVGLLSMFGISIDNLTLQAWLVDRATMKISTAFGMVALSYLLLQKHLGHRSGEIHGSIFLAIIMALGFMGYSRETDEVMTVGTFVPSVGTLCCFMSFAASSFFSSVWLFRLVRLAATVAIVGHILGIPQLFYYFPEYATAMALNTSIAFFVASFLRP